MRDGGIKKERTELDILLETFPDLSSVQIQVMLAPFKAKMLTAYLLNSLEYDEIKMMEDAIKNRLLNRIGREELLKFFDTSLEQQGLGLSWQTARKFSSVVEEVVAKANYIAAESSQSQGTASLAD